MRRAGRGEAPSFDEWYEASYARVLEAVRSAAVGLDARDLTDEAFVRALLHWRRVSAMASPVAWTVTVGRNLARRRHRRAAMERRLLRLARAGSSHEPSLPERPDVWSAIERLPVRQRDAMVLRYVEDRTEMETAELLGCSVGTVKSQCSKALAKLRLDSSLEDERSRS